MKDRSLDTNRNTTGTSPLQSDGALAIDIGGSKLLCGLVETSGSVLTTRRQDVSRVRDPSQLLQIIIQETDQLLKDRSDFTPTGVGVTIPGLVNRDGGLWKHAPFSKIEQFPIASELAKRLHLQTWVENDVNACALAEKVFGSCSRCANYVWITVSNGIGGALFLNDRLYPGYAGHAGEIGHTKVVANGNPCDCGKRGCLEAHASGRAIAASYRRLASDRKKAENCNARAIAALARQGDEIAADVFHEAGRCLGRAIGNAINLLNVEKAIVGGGVNDSWDLISLGLNEALEETLFSPASPDVLVEPTRLGYNAALLGASALTNPYLRTKYL